VRRSSYHVSDGSLDRTTGTNAHQAPQKAPPHATHYSAHNLSIQDTYFALVVLVSIREHTSGYHYRTYWELTGFRGCTGMVGVAPLAALVDG
jgi:hypothetical protein